MKPPNVPPMRSRVGLGVEGDNLVWGRSVRRDLVGRTSMTGLTVLAATGRLLSREDCELVDDFITALMATDARIWPVKTGRVVASFGSAASGFSAAQLACNTESMGPLIVGAAAVMLHGIRERLGERQGDAVAVKQDIAALLAQGQRLAGFGAPLRPADERVVALLEGLQRRGREDLRHLALAEKVAQAASELRGLQPNIALYGGALLLDVGLAPDEVGDTMLGLGVPLLLGSAREGALLREPQLRELPADAVDYQGPAPRTSPRAARRR